MTGKPNPQLAQALDLHKKGKHGEALMIVQRVLMRNAKSGNAHFIASGILVAKGDLARAEYHARQSIKSDPTQPAYHAALAGVLMTMRDFQDAIPHYQHALSLDADLPDALNGLGVAYKETGRSSDAIELFDQLLRIQPDNQDTIINRALLDSNSARTHDALVRLEDASARFPKNPILHDSLALISSYDDAITPAHAYELHQRFGRVLRSHIRPKPNHSNTPDPDRKLRIGYLSAEFRQHSNSYFLAPILDHHDADHTEIFLYSTNGYTDHVTDRLRSAADHWRQFRSNDLRNIIDTIQEDQIDILVELTGHFASNNLPVMAAKPAPVQITYLGYANTTGLDTIDFRIIDHTTDPAPDADALNTEQLIRLDGCFLTYEPADDAPEIRAPDPDRPFTLASFNDLKKLSPTCVDAWCRILSGTPGTRLILKNTQLDHAQIRDQIADLFLNRGIDPHRLHIVGRIESTTGHLDLYNEVDLALDTFPYTGTTTTCESLIMGVPVLTLVGNTHAGRVSASILNTIGLNEDCAPSIDEYVHRAITIASEGKRTDDARRRLRARVLGSALCDAASFVPKLESAYRSAWAQWCNTHGAPS